MAMEPEQSAGSCPAPGQTAVRTRLRSSTRGATKTPGETVSRYHGDGVRYKAKLIGVDPVPEAQGEKMCWDSMMKLKGLEAAARKQGKHKQRVWMKISSTGVKIVDERTGSILYDHESSRISSVTKDESDPRALAYVYQHQDAYSLLYIKTANLADPVLVDVRQVCGGLDQETPQEPAQASHQGGSLLLLNESSAPPPEENGLELVFSPRPNLPSEHSQQASSSDELMDVFSFQAQEPLASSQSSCSSAQPEPPPLKLSTSQILSMFPVHPAGPSPYSSPPYSPTASPWGLQGPLAAQWAGPAAVAPGPPLPGSAAPWAPAGAAAPPAGGHAQAACPQPGMMWGGTPPPPAAAVSMYHSPFNASHTPHP
ncbi:disabled homolog 1-like [Betta splendens]|uniref:Disabled homolog 1-like n=1 Tax=Betta splendens TaxID=158456 RepID=A0A6P7MCZ5_BETSP|nr:disabled homolog 1-like [Betta splendens]